MKRVELAELQRDIEIQLRVLRGPVKTALQHIHGDQAAEIAARLIVERCRLTCAIFKPDRVNQASHAQRNYALDEAGRFGRTEPWPTPPAEEEHPLGCRICSANDVEALQEQLAMAMWAVLMPDRPLHSAGAYRARFLLIAARAINWLRRAHA